MQKHASRRREFLGYSLFGLSSFLFNRSQLVAHTLRKRIPDLARSDTTAYICESGNIGRDTVFTLGLLLVPQAELFEQELQQLRSQYQYFPRLAYSNNDRYQIPLAQAAIRWLFQNSNARFQVIAFDEKIESSNAIYRHAPSRWQLLQHKQTYYDQLIEKAGVKDSMVFVKYQSPLGPSPAYGQHFFARSNCYYQAIDTRSSNALQLCGLLTGCVAADYQGRKVNTIKQALIGHLKQVLGREKLQPDTYWQDRFVFYGNVVKSEMDR